MVDACVVNWILATVSKGVFDIIRRDRHDAFTLWNAVLSIFQDNELQRAVYLEAELRTLQQGDMSINAYCTKLKRLADQLRDIGHPISEPSQVLNLLHGLNPKYRYVKPVITSKYPPHTFMSARPFLILEELGADHDATAEAGQAFTASHGASSGGTSTNTANPTTDSSSTSNAPRNNSRSNNNRANNRFDRRRGRGGSSRQANPTGQNASWAAGYNPWQGMVQAWPMPFRAPGAGVLGPRPPFQAQQAMAATHLQQHPPGTSTDSFNTSEPPRRSSVRRRPASAAVCVGLVFRYRGDIAHVLLLWTFLPGRRCSDVRAAATSTPFVYHSIKHSLLHR